MRVFIDGLKLIRVESYEYIDQIILNNNQVNWLKNEGFNQFFVTSNPIELHLCDTISINNQIYPLEIGVVTLTKEFEEKFRYSDKLGYDYQKNQTTFYIFSPVAKEIKLVLDEIEYDMEYAEPIYKLTVSGDFHLKPYYYLIRLVDKFKKVKDPYTLSSSLTDSYVIDFNQLVPIEKTPIKVKNYVDTIIYEGHIRDLTINLDVLSKGLYLGVTEYSEKLKGSVLEYIKKLGMTHLQLLPIFDFEGVDDVHKDKLYNWGYNPSQYFAVEGWFSKDPSNPILRLNELRTLINDAHKLKLGINMDVVYNHVYQHKTFPYDDIVPGYFYRHDHKHKMTDASYCGNDLETRCFMVRKLIVDSLSHFASNFQIDGFRFDLMGLLDLETMHEIEKSLKKINKNIMLYGEGWNMLTEVPARQRSNMNNQQQFQTYAHFNDFYRNTMKGELHGPGLGYTMGNKNLTNKAMEAIIGSPHIFTSPNQSINYVECHDNLTYYDKMLLTCGFENPQFKDCQDFANHLIAISQGVPFYHAGQEFYRSKKGVENSYNSLDFINQIEWNVKENSISKLKKLLKIRKKFKLYRQTSYSNLVSITKENNLIIYRLEDEKNILLHYIKNTIGLEKLDLHQGNLIFPSQDVLRNSKYFVVDKPGIYIINIKK
jgi:pullulanase